MKGMNDSFQEHIDQWYDFCSWSRFYPDLYLDLLKPERGGINLHLDQRIFLRIVVRFVSVYGVFPRGYGKTFDEVLAGVLCCIFFPGLNNSLSAQTKENAADLLQSKFNEVTKFYPLLLNEVKITKFAKGTAFIEFKNGPTYDILVNGQQSKGQRRHRMTIEESALLNNDLFQDALEPIVNIGRNTVGVAAIVDPCELNHQINFFTTSGFRGSDEYRRSVKMVHDMINLTGSFVFGSGWQLACWYGRGLSKSAILKKKKEVSTVSFAQNFESKWVGVADNALVDVNRLLNCRTLTKPMLYNDDETEEIYLGVDVARSENKANNQSSIDAVRVVRGSDGRITRLEVVNTMGMSNTLNFTAQAIEVKRAKKRYNARLVISDGNGLSSGLIDELLKTQIDPITGEELGCWNTINTDNKPENELQAETCLWDVKAQHIQTKIIVDFMDAVDSGRLRMLEHKRESDFTVEERNDMEQYVLPFVQADYLFEEIANLKLKKGNGATLQVEQATKRINKDRWSALAYAIYYIMEYENDYTFQDISDMDIINEYTFV